MCIGNYIVMFNMNTLEVEIAIINEFFRSNIVVPNVSYGITYKGKPLHECDILCLTKSGFATEFEIKVSVQDFKNDFKKKHKHNHILIKHFYYVVPVKMKEIAIDLIEKHAPHAGLYVISKPNRYYRVTKIKSADKLEHVKWGEELQLKLLKLGTMRIYGLKKTILKLKK